MVFPWFSYQLWVITTFFQDFNPQSQPERQLLPEAPPEEGRTLASTAGAGRYEYQAALKKYDV